MHLDFYTILGVERNATKEVITAAYRRAAMKWHPDRHMDPVHKVEAERKFKEIQEAYNILMDEVRRTQYDRHGSTQEPFSGRSDRQRSGHNYYEFWRQRQEHHQQHWQEHLPRGADIKKKVAISLEEAIRGAQVCIEEIVKEACQSCDGFGLLEPDCPDCQGQGRVDRQRCVRCGGVGRFMMECKACEGVGKVIQVRTIKVRTPPGVVDGSILTASGRGKPSRYGGLPGDLILTIAIKLAGGWKCKGPDLHGPLKLCFSTAMLGGSADVTLPTGKTVRVEIAPRTNSGKRIRLAGQGLRNSQTGDAGDVVLLVSIVLPRSKRKLTDEMEQVLRQIDK